MSPQKSQHSQQEVTGPFPDDTINYNSNYNYNTAERRHHDLLTDSYLSLPEAGNSQQEQEPVSTQEQEQGPQPEAEQHNTQEQEEQEEHGTQRELLLQQRANRRQKSRSVDLSHFYLLDKNESNHFLSQSFFNTQDHNDLNSKVKTIEMYKETLKKTNDYGLLFQYAQFILQTALSINEELYAINEHYKELKKELLKDSQRYLKKLSDKGIADAQYLLGDCYSSGAFGKIDNKEAFQLFQAAAKKQHIESAYRTSYCYEEGLGTIRDSRRALEFLKFASAKNHPAAMFKLGYYSFYARMGLPDNVNVKKSGLNWLSRAADSATELTNSAPYELAKIYEVGFLDILIPDHKYAVELYIKAASLGHIKSASIMGKLYEFGDEVVEQNSNLSIHYYTLGAMGGDPEAMLGLCAWYLIGNPPNLLKDEIEAFQWALKSANANFPKAQFTVGYFYERGIGCDADLNTAKKWFKEADSNGYEKARIKLTKIAQQENKNTSNSNSSPTLAELNDNNSNNNTNNKKHRKRKSIFNIFK